MNARHALPLASCLLAGMLVAASSVAAPPVVEPGDCLYLVGAPPGEPLAPTESTASGTHVYQGCTDAAYATVHGSSPTSVEVAVVGTGVVAGTCRLWSWTGHEFTIGMAAGPVRAEVDMAGTINGSMFMTFVAGLGEVKQRRVVISIEIQELSPGSTQGVVVAEATVLDITSLVNAIGVVGESFDRRLSFDARPGGTYRAQLYLLAEQAQPPAASTLDFGSPGSGNGAQYSRIKVCVEAQPEDLIGPQLAALADSLRDEFDSLRDELDSLRGDDLELKLYARQCLPTLWMPASAGGRLEEARALAADLVARAISTGDPGVNAHVASDRLARADSEIAAGQYQRACRSLSDTVRALTTP